MSEKKDIDRKQAEQIAEDFLQRTKGLYRRAEVAGSIRRKEMIVHDIDFAVIPSIEDLSVWKIDLKKKLEEIGGRLRSAGETICDISYKGLQVNLFLCPDDKSWGITLMWATGPKGHTIGMNIKARNKGLLLNSRGIWTRDNSPRQIPAETEQDVGRILGWEYKPPEARGKDEKVASSFF